MTAPRRHGWDSADDLLEEWASLTRLPAPQRRAEASGPSIGGLAAGAATIALVAAVVGLIFVAMPLHDGSPASPPLGGTPPVVRGSPSPSGQGAFSGAWQLERGAVDGRPLPLVDDHPVTLVVERDRTGGTAACNDYGAEIAVVDGEVRAQVTSLTAMLCAEPAMALEDAYLEALPRVSRASVEADHLILRAEGVELRFLRLAPPPVAEIVDRVWHLEELTFDDGRGIEARGEDVTFELRSNGTLEVSTGSRTLTGRWIEYGAEIDTPELAAEGDDPPPALAQQDSHVLGVIEGGFTARIVGGRLSLASRDGDGLVYRQPMRPTPAQPSPTAGEPTAGTTLADDCPSLEPHFLPDDLVERTENHDQGISVTVWSAADGDESRSVIVRTGWGEPEGGRATGRQVTFLGNTVPVYEAAGDTQFVFTSYGSPSVSTCTWLVVSAIRLSQNEFDRVVESVARK